MKLYSTSHNSPEIPLRDAIFTGVAPDKGLYMPRFIPRLKPDLIKKLRGLPFQEIASTVATLLLEDEIPPAKLKHIVYEAFNFDVSLQPLGEFFALELFHGPTLAFKDFGARFLAQLTKYYTPGHYKQVILVATSGDTGSAVASAFHNIPGIHVVLLYPKDKISRFQEKQLTCWGKNITPIAIEGTFDDCQTFVKTAFSDSELALSINLSSANSINIARLLGQIFYYFFAYTRLPDTASPIVISVPSGNLGNLTAGIIAKRMGLPISNFIASTNVNDAFSRYLQTGVTRPLATISTLSNSMDVGNPSNLARIQELYNHKLQKIRQDIETYSFTDRQTLIEIGSTYKDSGYILDPHSAIGLLGLKAYSKHHRLANGIFLATAHPVKFKEAIEQVINSDLEPPPELSSLFQLSSSIHLKPSYKLFKRLLLERFV